MILVGTDGLADNLVRTCTRRIYLDQEVAALARVAVKPEILRWALHRTQEEESIQKRFPAVTKWLNNETQPTLKQLEEFAKATATPLGFFFLSKLPEIKLSIPHYRTLRDRQNFVPSPDLLETVQTMERRQAWMREYLQDMGHGALSFVGSCNMEVDPKEAAKKIRSTVGLESGWAAGCRSWKEALALLIDKVERTGVLVVRNGIVGFNTRRKLNVQEFRGFVLVDGYAPLIFINGADGQAAQMFTIAHELAHIWYGQSAAFDLSDLQPAQEVIERVCNQTAAEILVPESELRREWENYRDDPQRFDQLARHFKVSSIVTARRSLDLGLIGRDEFFEFYHQWMEAERRSNHDGNGGGNFYLNLNYRIGRRFAEAVILSAKAGRISYGEAYRLTGLKGDTFTKYARHLGIEV